MQSNNQPSSQQDSIEQVNGKPNDFEFTIDPNEPVDQVLERFKEHLKERTKHHFGYPYNLKFDHTKLAPFYQFCINNLGDPFVPSNYGVHARAFERDVLDYFADLWKIPTNEYWGYITNCGTEGNLYGILLGREVLPDGILYASRESHYSVFKAARYYRMPTISISTLKTGEINYDELEQQLEKNKDKPAIINCNVGTTVKGAVDNIDKILASLKKTGYSEDRFFIHCDGALNALILCFIKNSIEFTFEKPIGSISVSGHKFVGAPMPCGVVITRKKYKKNLEQHIDYLNSLDTTIMGSRNGQAALCMWYTIKTEGKKGFARAAKECLDNANLMAKTLRTAGIGCMLNEYSTTVVLEKPPTMEFIKKWQLACEGNLAHVVVMPNITTKKIKEFVDELVELRKKLNTKNICIAQQIGSEHCLCEKCMVQSSYDIKED